MPSLTRLTTGGVLNPLKNTTNTSHNELLHQDPLQPPLEPREETTKPLGLNDSFKLFRKILEPNLISFVHKDATCSKIKRQSRHFTLLY